MKSRGLGDVYKRQVTPLHQLTQQERAGQEGEPGGLPQALVLALSTALSFPWNSLLIGAEIPSCTLITIRQFRNFNSSSFAWTHLFFTHSSPKTSSSERLQRKKFMAPMTETKDPEREVGDIVRPPSGLPAEQWTPLTGLGLGLGLGLGEAPRMPSSGRH